MRTPNVLPVVRSSSQSLVMAAGAVAVVVLAAAMPARAQYRVGADGHVNDANSRLGSGGYNSASDASNRSGLANQVGTGNTTGLSGFHGNIQSFDPNVVQTNTQDGGFQNFTRQSAPQNYAARSTGAPAYTPYYNTQNYTGSTSSYVPTANGIGLVPAPTKSALTPDPGDVRLQNLNNSPLDQNGFNLPTQGSLAQPGPVSNVGDQQVYSQSSLYGVRQFQAGDQAQTQSNMFDQRYNGIGRPGVRMDTAKIDQMRQELRDSSNLNQQPTDGTTDPTQITGTSLTSPSTGQPGQPGTAQPGTPGQPGQPAGMNAVSGTTVTGTSVTAQRVPSSINTPYSSQQNNVVIPANQQSRQIQELERRFALSNPKPSVMDQANQNNRLMLAMKAAKEAKAKAAAGQQPENPADKTTTGGEPSKAGVLGAGTVSAPSGKGGITTTDQPQTAPKGDLPPVVRDAAAGEPTGNPDSPFVITSLAPGIKAPGLAKLLHDAEGQMRSGQFARSVETYDTAAEVAPSNPFVPLGRGFAELGASYYGKAEADLTRAILTEPALLVAQYDLKGFLGADRLKFVQKDLNEIGTTEQTARPYLLLAYIDHNTGADDTTVTGKDLDLAAQRGANPRLIELMREAWNLKPAK